MAIPERDDTITGMAMTGTLTTTEMTPAAVVTIVTDRSESAFPAYLITPNPELA